MFVISACSPKRLYDSYYYCQKFRFNCIRDNKIVSFKTSKGNFDVKLFGRDNPVTVTNFIFNIKKNIYSNQKFYKIIDFPQLKVIHSGIKSINNQNIDKNSFSDIIHPQIPLEIKFKQDIEPKYNFQIKDPFDSRNLTNIFESGSIAMIKKGKKSSSSTEFFFVTNKIPELDGRYSVFGKVVKGFEVLEKIDKSDFIYEITLN